MVQENHTPENCVPMATLKERVRNMEIADVRIEAAAKSNLEATAKHLEERIDKLETNQRWGVLTILGLLVKAAFDWIRLGGGS